MNAILSMSHLALQSSLDPKQHNYIQKVNASAESLLAIATVDDSEIAVMAFPAEASALDFVMPMLKAGKIAEAMPYLET